MVLARALLWMLCCLLAQAVVAQPATLSARPLADALQNGDLLLEQGDEKLAQARAAVEALLLNKPTEHELKRFHARLAALARHRDSRLGRLFFALLRAAPDVHNVGASVERASVTADFALALGSGASVHVGWTRRGEAWLVSELTLSITGNAGALAAAASPYFAQGAPMPEVLNAGELDYLLGRDMEDRGRLPSERTEFDFDAALRARFAIEDGAPAALLESLADGLAAARTPARKTAALAACVEVKGGQAQTFEQAGQRADWKRVESALAALRAGARASGAPVFRGSGVSVRRQTATGETQWSVRRLAAGRLVLSRGEIDLGEKSGK